MGLVIGPPLSWNWLPPRDRGLVLPPALTDIATRLGNAAWLMAVFQVSDDRTRIIGLSVDSGTPPQQELRDCLNRVLHHVQRASRLAHAVEARTARQAAAVGMLAHVDHSMAAIDPNRKIEFANPAFEQLLNDQTIFSIARGRLVMIDPKEDRRLRTALSEVIAMCATATEAPVVAQRSLVSRTRMGGAPLMIRVAPLRQPSAVANPLAVITVYASAPTLDAASIGQRFSLTPAELRLVAVLSADATQAQIAVRLGRSVNTVKTQLSSIYHKTGARNRAELLLALASRAG